MKPTKKKAAKVYIAIIAIVAVLASLFTFVPMNFGSYSFTSLLGAISCSTELGGGVYAEYEMDGEYSNVQINNSIQIIKDVLASEGYLSSSVYSTNQNKIRIEIGYPLKSSSLKASYSFLQAVAVGDFELRSSSAEKDTYVVGSRHIKSVELSNYNSQTYVVLNFNKDGEDAYKNLLSVATTVYVCMGGQVMTSMQVDSGSTSSYSSMPLSFSDYNSAKDFAMRVKLGSMPITLAKDVVNINTMGSTLGFGSMTANPNAKLFGVNATKIAGIVAIVLVIILGLVFMSIKYGVIGAFQALALLFDTIIALILLWAFPWIEISFSSLIALAFGYACIFASSLVYTSRFEDEYKQGKTITAGLESGYKKSVASILATGIALTIIFGVVAIVASGEIKVFGLITCIFSMLSMFSSLIMLPKFISIFEAFNDGAIKPYRLQKREEETHE